MPTHTYMSPEPPARGAFAPLKPGIRAARVDADRTRRPGLSIVRFAELSLIAFTAAAGVWCLYEAVRLFAA